MREEGSKLENRLKITNRFKSEGERRIAYFLESNSIDYRYEPGVLVQPSQDKPRIWYPDFFLPEFAAYIEYYGLAGHESYDRGIKQKELVYSRMGLDVIPVYPWTFAENWQDRIMNQLQKISVRRYENLMSKPYWSAAQPNPRQGGYRARTKHY